MSTYKVIELVGSSYTSWDDAAKRAIETASKTLRDLRIAEVVRMDMRLEEGGRILFRTRLKVSFKVHDLEKLAETLGTKPYAHEDESG